MLSVKEYNQKLQRLRNTRKMTGTMKLVSANKRRKAQEQQRRVDGFAARLDTAVGRLASVGAAFAHPLTTPRTPVRRALLLVITSDMGLCGGFNNNLDRLAAEWMAARGPESVPGLAVCGRRGWLYFRRRAKVDAVYEGVVRSPSFSVMQRISRSVQAAFAEGAYDEVYVAANAPTGALSYPPRIHRLLPVELPEGTPDDARLYDPAPAPVWDALLPQWVDVRLFAILAASVAAEHGARMLAMESSASNADRLINEYTLLRNRARQAAITRELNEIVAGAEALA